LSIELEGLFKGICQNSSSGKLHSIPPATAKDGLWHGSFLKLYIKAEVAKHWGDFEKKFVDNGRAWSTFNSMPSDGSGPVTVEIAICTAAQLSEKESLDDFILGYVKECIRKGWDEHVKFLDKHKDLVGRLRVEVQKEPCTISMGTRSYNQIEFLSGQDTWLNPYNIDAIPYVGREAERARLNAFAKHQDLAKVWAIVGPSGSGKTRLAAHWMRTSESLRGWECIMLRQHDRDDPAKWALWTPSKPTLLILDYMFGFENVLKNLLKRLQESLPYRTRLLVLDHVFADPLEQDARWGFEGLQSSLDFKKSLFYENRALSLGETSDQTFIIRNIIQEITDLPEHDSRLLKASRYLQNTPGAWHPLFAALIGDAIKKNQDYSAWSRRELIGYYLQGERLIWQQNDVIGQIAACFISVATARRGIRFNDLIHYPYADDHNILPNDFQPVIKICKNIASTTENTVLPAFEPDLLGESFFLLCIQKIQEYRVIWPFFLQMFLVGDEQTQKRDAIEFIGFVERLTRNLLNDDQDSEETEEFWAVLQFFLNPDNFPKQTAIRWAVSSGLIRMVKQLSDAAYDKKAKQTLEQVDKDSFYHGIGDKYFEYSILSLLLLSEYQVRLGLRTGVDIESLLQISSKHFGIEDADNYPMLLSAINDCSNVLDSLLDFGVNIEAEDKQGNTALIWASVQGHENVVLTLIDWGADIEARANNGVTALMAAIFNGHEKTALTLLDRGADIEVRDANSITALMAACYTGHEKTVQTLLDQGADIEARDTNDATALVAASISGHEKTVQTLLDQGADIETRDNDDTTALVAASISGHEKTVQTLLNRGADIEARYTEGQTALMAACYNGHEKTMQTLLDRGADIEARANNGSTALIAASVSGHEKTVQTLLNRGADIEARNNKDITALMAASISGHEKTVQTLLDQGADIEARCTEGQTALMIACYNGHEKTVQTLLDQGADIEARYPEGQTALMAACYNGHEKTVQTLLDRGANLEARDNEAQTALMWATENGRENIVKLLSNI